MNLFMNLFPLLQIYMILEINSSGLQLVKSSLGRTEDYNN